MFLYSKASSRKLVHYPHCRYVKSISRRNRGHFDNLDLARDAGYHLCNCCSPIARCIHKEKSAILGFCKAHSIHCELFDGQLKVTAPNSEWIIIVSENKKRLFLYHKNTYERNLQGTDEPIIGYHPQHFYCNSILRYLIYVVNHEEYRMNFPIPQKKIISTLARKGTKRWRKEQRLKKELERKAGIRNVFRILDELNK